MPETQVKPNSNNDATVHHESRRSKRSQQPARMQLNLTSMIDVIFQLLIYFVVTASFAAGEGIITAKLPQGTGGAPSKAEPPKQPLNIILSSAGTFGYNIGIQNQPAAPRDFEQLATMLEGLQFDPERGRSGAYKPDHPVIIKPAGNVRWQHVVNAFNAAITARYSNVSFAQATQASN